MLFLVGSSSSNQVWFVEHRSACLHTSLRQVRTGSLFAAAVELNNSFKANVFVVHSFYVEGVVMSDVVQPNHLLEMLKLVFSQFRVVARIHEIVIANMQRIKVRQVSFS